MMSKTAMIGSLAVALLASGCAVSGPSLFPGFFVFLDAPEEDSECAGDCPDATVVAPAEQEKAELEEEESPAPQPDELPN